MTNEEKEIERQRELNEIWNKLEFTPLNFNDREALIARKRELILKAGNWDKPMTGQNK